jgi:hypothetical protein
MLKFNLIARGPGYPYDLPRIANIDKPTHAKSEILAPLFGTRSYEPIMAQIFFYLRGIVLPVVWVA